MRRLATILAIAAAGLVLCCPLFGGASEPPPSASDLLTAALQSLAASSQVMSNYTYKRQTRVIGFDDKRRKLPDLGSTSEYICLKGKPYKRLLTTGNPSQRTSGDLEPISGTFSCAPVRPAWVGAADVQVLAAEYESRPVRRSKLGGRSVYVVELSPKAAFRHDKNCAFDATLWIDTRDLHMVRVKYSVRNTDNPWSLRLNSSAQFDFIKLPKTWALSHYLIDYEYLDSARATMFTSGAGRREYNISRAIDEGTFSDYREFHVETRILPFGTDETATPIAPDSKPN